ncbi:hypothetical protein FVEG_06989 [Fusarium verticillioides 7600]|uniref:Uncharacterized protein n=1 Tax=Gibberella moniliformis (strain M3125 / FGSC 7600) TaxID=334819 RepID=W7MG74_GIBM7|nr:hypothetical protein FVEG_06989 [Fusarium verticillioides 7600]EWG46540.1 hypothetical protein FVEG_06989 [Fusarium verticillioides 7600]
MVLTPITAQPELLMPQPNAALCPPVPSTPPSSEAETSEPDYENEESERSVSLKTLMLLSNIDHATSPNYANPDQLYDEAAKHDVPELIKRYYERLCERFKLNPTQPIPDGIPKYFLAYEILGKALQSKGTRLEPLRLNMEVDENYLGKELPNSQWGLSAVKNGKFLADHGRYYDIMLDESPYIRINGKLSHFSDELDELEVQTVYPTAEYLPTYRRQLQQLRSVPRPEEDGFKKSIDDLSSLFEEIERSDNSYNRLINYLRLYLYHDLSFNLAIVSDGFDFFNEVDDEQTDRFKLLERRVQTNSKGLDLELTRSMKILKENDTSNYTELSARILRAQALQSKLKLGVLLEKAIDECDCFLLEPDDDKYEMSMSFSKNDWRRE